MNSHGEESFAKSSGSGKVIALAVVGGLVLAAGGYWLFAMFGGGDDEPNVVQNQNQVQGQGQTDAPPENGAAPQQSAVTGIDLTYLPHDCEVIVHARVGEIWNSPFIQELIQGPEPAGEVKKLLGEFGLEIDDLATVTVGISGVLEPALKAAAAGPLDGAAEAGAQAASKSVVVLRLNRDVTPEKLRLVERHHGQPVEHLGQTYFIGSKNLEKNEPGQAVYLPGPGTIVVASVEAVKRVIERGKTGLTGAPLDFVDAKQQLIVAVVAQDRDALLAQAPPEEAIPPSAAEFQLSLKNHLHAVALGLTFGKGLDVQVALGCDDAPGAEKVMAQLQPLLDQGEAMFESAKGEMNPLVVGLVAPIVENTKLRSDTKTASVTLTASLPPSFNQSLAQLPMLYSMMMMSWMAEEGGLPIASAEAPIIPFEVPDPGNLTGQPAVDIEGVPEGLALEVLARWSERAPRDKERKKLAFPLELLVILRGEPAAKAYAYGNLKIKTATATGGAAMTQYVSEFMPWLPEKQLVALDALRGFAGPQPTDAVHAVFAFVHPSQPVEEIDVFEGTVQLQIPEESVTRTLGLQSLEIRDPALKEAGVTLKKFKRSGRESVQIDIRAPAVLTNVELREADGEPYRGSYELTQDATRASIIAGDRPLPEDVKLMVTMHTKFKVLEVPFRFEKVSVSRPSQ